MEKKKEVLQESKERLGFLQSKSEPLSGEERVEMENLQRRLKELKAEQEKERIRDIMSKTSPGHDEQKYKEYQENKK